MVGFTCTVCGRVDPSEFYCGLTLTFDGPPPLSTLKAAIEERVMADAVLPDGATYIVCDVEILDFRLGQWVPVDSRTQLYSGCQLAAIRDTTTGTAFGVVDVGNKRPDQKTTMLAFAADGQKLFAALDGRNAGVLTLKAMLKVLRHDVNYAIDLFTALDERAVGTVNFQDFMAAYHKHVPAFWRELHLRIQHGGKLPGGVLPESTAAAGSLSTASPGRADTEVDSAWDARSLFDGIHTPPAAAASTHKLSFHRRGSLEVPLASIRGTNTGARDTIASAVVAKAGDTASDVATAKRHTDSPIGDIDAGSHGTSEVGPAAAAPAPVSEAELHRRAEEARIERARKVVNILQSTIGKKSLSRHPTAMGERILRHVRERRQGGGPATGGGTVPAGGGSPGSPGLSRGSPAATRRKP